MTVILIVILMVVLIYLLAIMPKIFHKADFSDFNGWFFAHRGLFDNEGHAPENSLAAFSLAVENGYGIELDVQLTKDNIPVVIHDYSLKRVCGVNKKVKDLTLTELKGYQLYNSQECIPTLKEALEVIGGKVPLILEYKNDSFDVTLYEIVSKMLMEYKGTYCIESFNPRCLMWYKKYEPDIIRGQLASNLIKDKESGNVFLYFLLQNLLLNFLGKPDFIAYNFIHKRMLSFMICRNLYKVKTFAWTIRSNEEYESCKEDFDYFIFDHFLLGK